MKKICKFGLFIAFFFLLGIGLFAQNARELSLGGNPTSGSLREGDEIWYSVRVRENGFLIVETTGDTDTYLEAFDDQRNLIKDDDDGGEDYNARIEMLVVAGKTYLFKLTGYGGREIGPFLITARTQPIPAATPLAVGSPLQGNLTEGSRDWYSVRTTGNELITVETSGSTDTYMEAFDSQYNLITLDDDSGSEYNARIEILADPNQTYLFAVTGYSNSVTGPYRIWVNSESLSSGAAQNTNRSSAVNIRIGEAIPIFFRTQNEARWYRCEIPRAGANLNVQTRGNIDTVLFLYDNNGNLITDDDDSGEGYNAFISERLERGTYFIEVRTYGGSTGRTTLHAEMR